MSFYVLDRIRFFANGKYEFEELTQEKAHYWLNTKRPWDIDIECDDTKNEVFLMLRAEPKEAPPIPKYLQLGIDDEALLVFAQPPKEHKREDAPPRIDRHFRYGVVRGVK